MGYSDHLVSDLLDEFGLLPGDAVLDPFCGSGTTAVECMKRGIRCWGVDANPASCFAARVKTTWDINPKVLSRLCDRVLAKYQFVRENTETLREDPTYLYLKTSGMIKRGWINPTPLLDIITLKQTIQESRVDTSYRNALLLAVTSELVQTASNVKFGPELYCGKKKRHMDVVGSFAKRVKGMCSDLEMIRGVAQAWVKILQGDARVLSRESLKPPRRGFGAVISSPPYPTEHDYTRNSRLELALLEAVVDRDSLRRIKKQMIRSHTKGIYSTDADSEAVCEQQRVNSLASRVDEKAAKKSYGFARLYGRVVKEYFGGMAKHFESLLPYLAPDARCAYIVGDQASYFGVHVPTAEILADIAASSGYTVIGIRRWRRRWATTSRRYLNENILFLRKRPTGGDNHG